MSTSNTINLFDSAKFFYLLHINPHQSVPHWEEARDQIDEFFLDFHDELVERVIMQMDLEEIPALIAIPFSDSVYEHNFRGFSKKDQFLLTGHYLILCCDVKEKIELLQMVGERHEGLIILHNEITMFIVLLNVIKKIVEPHGNSPHRDDNTLHCNGSRTISSSSSGRSTPTDSGISSDDEVESKKEIKIESTDEDDFEAYNEEIHKIATALVTSDLPPFNDCDQILDLLNKEKERRERPFEYFCEAEFTTEFPASSTVINPSEFFRLDAYQKLLRRNQ